VALFAGIAGLGLLLWVGWKLALRVLTALVDLILRF